MHDLPRINIRHTENSETETADDETETEPHVTVHKVDDGYTIAAGGIPLPGVYDTELTANFAYNFDDRLLAKFTGVITLPMLQAIRKPNNADYDRLMELSALNYQSSGNRHDRRKDKAERRHLFNKLHNKLQPGTWLLKK